MIYLQKHWFLPLKFAFSKALQNSIRIENFHRILLGLFHEIHIFSSKKHQMPPFLNNCPIIFWIERSCMCGRGWYWMCLVVNKSDYIKVKRFFFNFPAPVGGKTALNLGPQNFPLYVWCFILEGFLFTFSLTDLCFLIKAVKPLSPTLAGISSLVLLSCPAVLEHNV